MSESAKRKAKKPESYGPKDRPEIIRLAGQAGSKVVTAENGCYIDGIPRLRRGEWRDCTLNACLTLMLNATGADATYERVMGLTGSCFRLSMCYGWDPGSVLVNTSYYYLGIDADKNAGRAYGMECYNPPDAESRDAQVMNSIDSGVPVLILSGRGEPEWGLVLGYERQEDGVKFFGRTYFDGDATEEELFTDNRYALTNKYPGEWELGQKLFNRPCEVPPALDLLRTALTTCLEMFAPHEKFGYSAYDIMIESFEGNTFTTEWSDDGQIGYIMFSLIDARRAAYLFLEQSAETLPQGEPRTRLTRAASLFKEMFEALNGAIPYENYNFELDKTGLNDSMRANIARALRTAAGLERQARAEIEEVIGALE